MKVLMANQIIGREEEIKSLNEILSRKESQFVAIYGRRRIGKTYLVRNFFKNQFTFYHTGTANEGMRDQLDAFQESLLDYGLLDCVDLPNWRIAFHELRRLLSKSTDERKIVFIDELPWLDTPRSKFLSSLERFWNGWASARDDIVLIVCGSAASWILNKIINSHGGLHNRVTDQIHLKPFSLCECEALIKSQGLSLSRKEICAAYMIFGGVPYYWKFLRKHESVPLAIDRLLFAETGKLRNEFDVMIRSLFRSNTAHRKIISTLANVGIGMTRQDLLSKAMLKDGSLFCEALRGLEQCGFIRRYIPFGRAKKDSLYQIVDCFSLFHLRFIESEPNPDPRYWSASALSPRQSAWEGLAFERVCLLHLAQLKAALGISGVLTHYCSWRHQADTEHSRGAQIDLLIDRADNVINICEMKFAKGLYEMKSSIAEELERKREVFASATGTGKSLHLTLITPSGVRDTPNSRILQSVITLDDLFQP